jgi:hypothetical protein
MNAQLRPKGERAHKLVPEMAVGAASYPTELQNPWEWKPLHLR